MDHQIILLPKDHYWDWVRACREYVLTYGPNLTSEPDMAGRYQAPGQVITFPAAAGGYAQGRDLSAWFERHYPGVRLDPIAVQAPSALEAEFAERVAARDRYGQKRRPFYLVWPTDYPVVTQRFGANPQIYRRFGMPAHEGLDLRALTNTNIYACFDGVVYEVHTHPKDHAYGIHVRILHRDGYRTVYAHLARALVSKGDEVREGQVIGKADSTGASAGAHLHLTLKRDGATARGETNYPKDVIDPTPYMVWPENRLRKTAKVAAAWAAEECLLGVCGRAGGPMLPADLEAVRTARLEAILLPMAEPEATLRELRAIHPGMLIAVTLQADLSDGPVPAAEFIAQVLPQARRWAGSGVLHFQIQPNPNLQSEGWGRSWAGGAEFAAWFQTVLAGLHEALPGCALGFPGLSPGEGVPGQRAQAEAFLQAAGEAAQSADWIGVNCYWAGAQGAAGPDGIGLVERYRRDFPAMLLMVTEFGAVAALDGPQDRARQILDFHRAARGVPQLGAIFGYVLSTSDGYPGDAWRREGEDGREFMLVVGSR